MRGIRKTAPWLFALFIVWGIGRTAPALEFKLLKQFPGAEAPKAVEVSPDGTYAAVMNLEGFGFWLIDTATLAIRQKVHFPKTAAKGWNYTRKVTINSFAEKPVECDFTENGRYLWVSFHNGESVVRYDVRGENEKTAVSSQKTFIHDIQNKTKTTAMIPKIQVGVTPKIVKSTPDSKYVLVANWHSNSVSVIDSGTLKQIKEIIVGGGKRYIPRGIAISSDSRTAYVANMASGTISVLSLETLTVIDDVPVTENPRHLLISNDDRYLYISDNIRGLVLKYNIAKKTVEQSVPVGSRARTIAMTPDGRLLFAAAHYSGKVAAIDTTTFTVLQYIDIERPMGLSVSPNGKQLWASSYQGGFVNVYEIIGP